MIKPCVGKLDLGVFDLRGVCGGKNDDERERRKRGVKELERIGKGSCGDPEMGIVGIGRAHV